MNDDEIIGNESISLNLPDKFNWVETSDYFFNECLEKCLNSKSNLFVSGPAGCGKSLIIKILSEMKKNVVVISTTGLTALNLSTDNIIAHTPHSFFMLPPVEIIPKEALYATSIKMMKALKACNILIIDEISMMSNQIFDFIMNKIKYVRKTIPRTILFGDPMQLSPVISNNNKIVIDYYDNEYNGKTMFFNSNYYPNMNFETVFLRKSFRQKDKDFEDALFKVGYNEYDQSTLDFLNQRVMTRNNYESQNKNYIQLCPTNSMVNKINLDYIKSLSGKEYIYKAVIEGEFPEKKIQNDKLITIKIGSQVMCVMNSYDPDANYRNGTVGTVIDAQPGFIKIEKADGSTTKVKRSTVNNYELYILPSGDISYNIKGSCNQLDAKPMRALTIHKSQGKSLDNAYISLNGFCPEGLLYVSLSRLRTLNGLGLSVPIEPWMIKYNTESFEFFQK